LSSVALSSSEDSANSGRVGLIGVVGVDDVCGETLGNVILAYRSGDWRLMRKGRFHQPYPGSKNRSQVFVEHNLLVWKVRGVCGLG
jgi:hypothetical protein